MDSAFERIELCVFSGLLPQSKSSKELTVPHQQELIPPAPIVLGVPGSNGPESTPLDCTTHDPGPGWADLRGPPGTFTLWPDYARRSPW